MVKLRLRKKARKCLVEQVGGVGAVGIYVFRFSRIGMASEKERLCECVRACVYACVSVSVCVCVCVCVRE